MKTPEVGSSEITSAGTRVLHLVQDVESTPRPALESARRPTPHAVEKKTPSDYERGDRRIEVALRVFKGLFALGLAVGHLPFQSTDVRIGPVPVLFAPFEVISDLNNASDHKAQGFEAPDDEISLILSLDSGNISGVIPLDYTYDTAGVPDTSEGQDIMKPGMYSLALNEREGGTGPGEDMDEDPACDAVKGNYRGKVLNIFTQDNRVGDNQNYSARLVSPEMLQICPAPGKALPTGAEVFIYQAD